MVRLKLACEATLLRILRSALQIADGLHSKSLNPTGALAIAAAVSQETAMLLRQRTIDFSFEA